uniref:Uncharacterized protein n=1 Tax=Florenciella parvula TaxID=236787 RepID=A0A7S2CNS0_9STRA
MNLASFAEPDDDLAIRVARYCVDVDERGDERGGRQPARSRVAPKHKRAQAHEDDAAEGYATLTEHRKRQRTRDELAEGLEGGAEARLSGDVGGGGDGNTGFAPGMRLERGAMTEATLESLLDVDVDAGIVSGVGKAAEHKYGGGRDPWRERSHYRAEAKDGFPMPVPRVRSRSRDKDGKVDSLAASDSSASSFSGGGDDDFGMCLEVDTKDDLTHAGYGRRRAGSRNGRGSTADVPCPSSSSDAKAPSQCRAGGSKLDSKLQKDPPSERRSAAALSVGESKGVRPPPAPSPQQAPQKAGALTCG